MLPSMAMRLASGGLPPSEQLLCATWMFEGSSTESCTAVNFFRNSRPEINPVLLSWGLGKQAILRPSAAKPATGDCQQGPLLDRSLEGSSVHTVMLTTCEASEALPSR